MDTIKTLEQRIKYNAIGRFKIEVEDVMRRVRSVAGAALEKPVADIGTLTTKEAIDMVYAAIIREQGPVVASRAPDSALEELADRLEPSRFATAGPSRGNQ